MKRSRKLGPLLLLAASAGPATTAPATVPATRPADPLADARRVEHDDLLRRVASLPTLAPATAAEVATLDVVDGHLRVRTTLPPVGGTARVPVTDLPGTCTVTLLGRRNGRPPATRAALYEPPSLLLEVWQFDRPGEVVTDTSVQTLPINVQVSRTAEVPGGLRQVSYVERLAVARADDPAGAVATLRVSDRRDDGTGGLDLTCTADSLRAMRRLHPREVATYLEPALRDLHADAALLPADPELAFQAFGADAPADPAVAAKVAPLVARLDADDFGVRDAAADDLRKLGTAAAVVLGRVDRAALSPEQRNRLDALLARYRAVPAADLGRLRDDRDFLLNCLLVEDDPASVRGALTRLRAAVGADVAFDDRLRGVPRRDAVWALRQRLAGPTTRQ